MQPKYNMTSHRDTAEGLEGKKVQQKCSKLNTQLKSDVIFDIISKRYLSLDQSWTEVQT